MLKHIFYSTVVMLAFAACKKDKVSVPELDISTAALTYKAGDSVIFNLSGNPDNLVFWSGKTGHEYQYRNRLFLEGNKLLLKFNTYQQYGTDKNLSVKVSDDFSEVFDEENVKKATWKDITDKVTLSTGADQTQSGTVNLSEIFDGKKPVTVAFRYVTTELKAQTRWVIRTFNLDNQTPAGVSTSLATMANAGWKALSFSNAAAVWSITSGQLLMRGTETALDDDWVFTKSFNPNAVSPDQGVAIKNVSTNLSSYGERYTTPGTYKVTFVASNTSYQNQETIVKEVSLTILP